MSSLRLGMGLEARLGLGLGVGVGVGLLQRQGRGRSMGTGSREDMLTDCQGVGPTRCFQARCAPATSSWAQPGTE